jgi:hypothetical protein
VLDNNEPGYFYLHYELSLGIQERSCAFLPLSIALKSDHYDLLLRSKIAQVTDTFQAKLGWLIGTNFNRVGTDEWDDRYPANKIATEVSAIMKDTLRTVDDRKIKQGLDELRETGKLEGAAPNDVFSCIKRQKVLSGDSQFRQRATDVLAAFNPYAIVAGRLKYLIRTDSALRGLLSEMVGGGEDTTDERIDRAVSVIADRVGQLIADPIRLTETKVAGAILGALFADAKLMAILKRSG